LRGNMIRTWPLGRCERGEDGVGAASRECQDCGLTSVGLTTELLDAICPARPRHAERHFLVAKRSQAVQ
jgi:hypothetical protein